MFKNRKTPLLAKKSSDLATIRESSSDGQPPSEPVEKVPRVDSGPAAAAAGENDDPFGSSQFSVPASQMCSQRRYLSQRTNLQKSQSARTSRRVPVNYFEHVLLQCQVDLDDPTSIVLRCEPIAFVRTVRSMLRTSPDYPRNVQDFVKGFEQTSRAGGEPFRKLLECCQLQNRNTGDLKPVQESLMKMLLCVEFMQLELITVLFECVERLARDGGESGLNLTGVKAVLAANDCSDVFWMGNLKNKDLRGDLLLSQQEPDEMDDDDDQEDDGDIGDFLSDDEEGAGGDAGRSATTMNRRESTRSSQSKCF